MQNLEHISSVLLCLLTIALAAWWILRPRLKWPLWRIHATTTPQRILSQALRRINVSPEWQKDNDKLITHYAYQGGHFNITLEKNSPYARLTYLYFYKTDMDRLDDIRLVCNLCNLNTDACRIVYTIDEKEGKVDIHLISVLPISYEDMTHTIERVMNDAFRWQNTFSKKISELGRSKGMDAEKLQANYSRELEIIREREMTHQEEGPDWHETKAMPYSMRDLLSVAMGLSDIIPTNMTVTKGNMTMAVSDPDRILNLKVQEVLIKENAFENKSAVAKLDFYDPRDLLKARHLLIDFEAEEQTPDTLYYRVTLSLSPLSLTENIDESAAQRQKLMSSILLGYDLTPSAERIAHFRYVWKEAMSKIRNGEQDSMTDEEKTLAKMQDSHMAENFYNGHHLFLHKRFYEALRYLTDAYREMTTGFPRIESTSKSIIDEIAYLIGCCYMNLRQYEKACYYLQMTLPSTHQSYLEAYINCLVNGKDFRALDTINTLLTNLDMMLKSMDMDNGEEEGHRQGPSRQQIERFVAFANRRKAYLLVSIGRYGEAETILKKLLDDPENSDFALTELAYIQKNKAKK